MDIVEWKPIETAPEDGKPFLGTKNLGVGYGWTQYVCRYCDFNKSFGALFSLAEGGIWYPLNEKNTPSHWMPLPPCPAE